MTLFHSSFKITAYNLAFQLQEVHRFIITFFMNKLHNPPVPCNFLMAAGSHVGSTLKCLWKSCNYVTYLRRNGDFLHLLLPRSDAAVRNDTYNHVGFSMEEHSSHTGCVLW